MDPVSRIARCDKVKVQISAKQLPEEAVDKSYVTPDQPEEQLTARRRDLATNTTGNTNITRTEIYGVIRQPKKDMFDVSMTPWSTDLGNSSISRIQWLQIQLPT